MRPSTVSSSPNSLRTLAARYDFVCFFLWLALTAYSSPLLVSTPILLRTIEFTYARSRARQTMSTNTNSIPPPRAPHAHALTPRIYPLIEFKSGRLTCAICFPMYDSHERCAIMLHALCIATTLFYGCPPPQHRTLSQVQLRVLASKAAPRPFALCNTQPRRTPSPYTLVAASNSHQQRV
ncbi:hypothetical protein C8R47DRAFT_1319811 [Mycena vitilis]|nr:hypothetical protein C8R47DRAFT_1319811 [Mycena vitilis]